MNAVARTSQRTHLEAALQCAKWINQARVDTDHGSYWRLTPDDDVPFANVEQSLSLDAGVTGIVLFLLELYAATSDESVLKDALSGADYVIATLPFDGSPPIDLHHGVAGAAYMLELVYQISGRAKDREAMLRCLTTIRRFVPTAEGQFFGRGNDVHSGRSGFGLALLWLHQATGSQEAFDLALLAGKTVLQRARPHPKGGMYWYTGESAPEMTSFGLGSAGMAYFLAVLYEQTGEREYLEIAVSAARHIQDMAFEYGNGWLISPAMDHGKTLQDAWGIHIGWFFGATGIWRLFFQLWIATKDPEWVEWIHRLAHGAMSLYPNPGDEIYERTGASPVGGPMIARNFLELFLAFGNLEYLAFAENITANLMQEAVVDELGMRWRTLYREKYLTRTCFGIGAAAMGTWFAQFDAHQSQRMPRVLLPNTPFQAAFYSRYRAG